MVFLSFCRAILLTSFVHADGLLETLGKLFGRLVRKTHGILNL